MGVFRQRANYRRSRRRLHAAVQWQYDTPPPSTPTSNPVQADTLRRRRRIEYRQPPRFLYEQFAAAARRRTNVPPNAQSPFGHFAADDGTGLIPNDFRGHWV